MPKRGFKTTSIGVIEYQLAEKMAKANKRSVKSTVEHLIIIQAQKEGFL